LLVLGAIAAVLRFAPLFTVEKITVDGNSQVTAEAVVDAAAVPDGTRVLTAPLDQIASRVESLDAIAQARVTRDWPNGLTIVVHERRPVGYVSLDGGDDKYGLVGSDGSVYRTETDVPDDLPQLPDAAVSEQGDSYRDRLAPLAVPAFDVAVALPRALQHSIATISAGEDGGVTMTSDDGVAITWGASAANALKGHVVALLMRRPGWGSQFTEVDVTAPETPALR
jgi:cell division protein FtsQ